MSARLSAALLCVAFGPGLSTSPTELYPLRAGGNVALVDRANKTWLASTPKGGATTTVQTFFRHEGVLEKALGYNNWIHVYRLEVFNKETNHLPVDCSEVCRLSDWRCTLVIRAPLDRIVSSYIHTMKTRIWRSWEELKSVAGPRYPDPDRYSGNSAANITFSDFLAALRLRARAPPHLQPRSSADNHFMPQSTLCTAAFMIGSGVKLHLVPVEAMSASLQAVGNAKGVHFTTGNMTSHHYIKKNASLLPGNVQNWPFSNVSEQHPAYEAFVRPKSSEARTVCFLFRDDFDLYRRACKQPWLRGCAECFSECAMELARADYVCER